MEELFTIYELSQILKISTSMAYKLARSVDFPSVKVGTRVLIPKEGLLEWLSQQRKATQEHRKVQNEQSNN